MAQSQFFKTPLSASASKQLPWGVSSRTVAGENPFWPAFTGGKIGLDVRRSYSIAVGCQKGLM